MWDFEIFDKASRGPWGAVVLLFRTKARSLAALGALLILLLLAIDTFFQQVVEMQTRWTLLDVENASGMLLLSTVPRVTHYSPRVSMEYRDGVELLQKNEELLTVANSFFYDNGTQPTRFGNGTRADIPVNCSTSNCTWPIYETLGVCSSCHDVSENLTFGCKTGRADWIVNTTSTGPIAMPNGSFCGYFFETTNEIYVLMSGYMLEPTSSEPGAALLVRMLPLVNLER
jgi:hypothetical protein